MEQMAKQILEIKMLIGINLNTNLKLNKPLNKRTSYQVDRKILLKKCESCPFFFP